jgi:hypothetical protein
MAPLGSCAQSQEGKTMLQYKVRLSLPKIIAEKPYQMKNPIGRGIVFNNCVWDVYNCPDVLNLSLHSHVINCEYRWLALLRRWTNAFLTVPTSPSNATTASAQLGIVFSNGCRIVMRITTYAAPPAQPETGRNGS